MAAEGGLHGVGHLTHGGAGAGGVDAQGQQVGGSGGSGLERTQRGLAGGFVSFGAQALQLVDLAGAHVGVVDLQRGDVVGQVREVFVHAHDGLLAGVDAGLGAGGGFLDAQLWDAGLDGLGHAAEFFHFLDVGQGAGGQIVGQALHIV